MDTGMDMDAHIDIGIVMDTEVDKHTSYKHAFMHTHTNVPHV